MQRKDPNPILSVYLATDHRSFCHRSTSPDQPDPSRLIPSRNTIQCSKGDFPNGPKVQMVSFPIEKKSFH